MFTNIRVRRFISQRVTNRIVFVAVFRFASPAPVRDRPGEITRR